MNAKLKLRLEDLVIDSFHTAGAGRRAGTVFGEQCTCPNYTPCMPTVVATCAYSCPDTCGDSCDGPSCDYSCACNSQAPCPTALYTNCNGMDCL